MSRKESEFDKLQRNDNDNYGKAKQVLGHAVDLPSDLLRVYDLHNMAVGPFLASEQDRLAELLYLICRKHLLTGVVSLFRLHVQPACAAGRGACEAAGLAHLVRRDKEVYDAFVHDTFRDDARVLKAQKRLKHLTTSTRLFPAEAPEMNV